MQKSSKAGRRGGEGVRREEQRDEMGQCERTDEFVSVRYIRDIFVKAWPTVIIQKRVAARFHLWTSEVHK